MSLNSGSIRTPETKLEKSTVDYRLTIGDHTTTLQCDTRDDNRLTAVADGRQLDAAYTRISPYQLHLRVNGKSARVFAADDPGGKTILIDGVPVTIQDTDALRQRTNGKKAPLSAPTEVTPPMPSVVVRVLVTEGEQVEKGQAVVIVSAMKMETTLTAPFAGTVSRINTAEGDKVAPKQILMDIEKEESS